MPAQPQTEARRWGKIGLVIGKIIGCCGGLIVLGAVAGDALSAGESIGIFIGSILGGGFIGGLTCYTACKIKQSCSRSQDNQTNQNTTNCCSTADTPTSSTIILSSLPNEHLSTELPHDIEAAITPASQGSTQMLPVLPNSNIESDPLMDTVSTDEHQKAKFTP